MEDLRHRPRGASIKRCESKLSNEGALRAVPAVAGRIAVCAPREDDAEEKCGDVREGAMRPCEFSCEAATDF
jgi:hypothetical protein